MKHRFGSAHWLRCLLAAAAACRAGGLLHRPAASASGSSGRVLRLAPAEWALALPGVADAESVGRPLLDVKLDERLPDPKSGADMLIAMSVDADLQLHLHPAASEAAVQAPGEWIALASAEYRNTVNQTGWAFLSVRGVSDQRIPDDLTMYAAGFLEGFASARQIRDFQHNANALMDNDEQTHNAKGNIRELFASDIRTIWNRSGVFFVAPDSVAAGKDGLGSVLNRATQPLDPWWGQARYMLMQAWGLLDAYNQYALDMEGKPMSMVDLLILNSDGETPELEMAYGYEEALLRQSKREDDLPSVGTKDLALLQKSHLRGAGGRQRERPRYAAQEIFAKIRNRRRQTLRQFDDQAWRKFKQRYGRCSALIRLAENNSDLFVGHTTFSDYSEMTRIFKHYDFPLKGSVAQRMSFSSYPGVMGSTDDYYLMDTGLAVTETTVSMLSDEAFDTLDDSGAHVPDYMRIMIANRLATSGEEWVAQMTKSATGTYNSQWMVVDYSRFEPGRQLKNGTLWLLEQAPGVSHSQDMSQRLQRDGLWFSANRAYFSDVRQVAGEAEAAEAQGRIFSAGSNPRANIFKKTGPSVNTLVEMRAEMQRNRWPHEIDGGVANTPDHAVAARGDLYKPDPHPNGGVDAKVTSACLARHLAADAISGPTHDGQTPFRWTDGVTGKALFPTYPRDGLPDVWNFEWVRMTPAGELSTLPPDACAIKAAGH